MCVCVVFYYLFFFFYTNLHVVLLFKEIADKCSHNLKKNSAAHNWWTWSVTNICLVSSVIGTPRTNVFVKRINQVSTDSCQQQSFWYLAYPTYVVYELLRKHQIRRCPSLIQPDTRLAVANKLVNYVAYVWSCSIYIYTIYIGGYLIFRLCHSSFLKSCSRKELFNIYNYHCISQ